MPVLTNRPIDTDELPPLDVEDPWAEVKPKKGAQGILGPIATDELPPLDVEDPWEPKKKPTFKSIIPPSEGIIAEKPKEEPTVSGEFVKGVKAGVEQVKGLGAGAVALAGKVTGIEPIEEWGTKKFIEQEKKAAEYEGAVPSYTDIEDVGSAIKYAAHGIGTMLPTMATSIATGGAAAMGANVFLRGAARKLIAEKMAEGLTKEAAVTAGREMLRKGVERAAIGGGFAASFGMEAGTIAGEQSKQPEGIRPLSAIVGGAAAGALDVLPEVALFKRLGVFGGKEMAKNLWPKIGKPLAEGESTFGRVIGEGIKQAAFEGSTESLQSVIERVSSSQPLATKEAFDDYINSGIIGALTGGLLGAGGSAVGKPKDLTKTPVEREKKKEEAPPIAEQPGPEAPPAAEPESAERKRLRELINFWYLEGDPGIVQRIRSGETVDDIINEILARSEQGGGPEKPPGEPPIEPGVPPTEPPPGPGVPPTEPPAGPGVPPIEEEGPKPQAGEDLEGLSSEDIESLIDEVFAEEEKPQLPGEEPPPAEGTGGVIPPSPPPTGPPAGPIGELGPPTPITEIDEGAHEAATSPTNDLPEPTEGQKEAGNYKKGHINIQGMDVSIENPVGSERSGVTKEGEPWTTTMKNHYGYILGTKGKDKDHIDTFIGDNPESTSVFVVNQIDPSSGKFDEHKVMLGFNSEEEARTAYLQNYQEGWQGLKSIASMTIDEFKTWAKEGDTTKEATSTESVEAGPIKTVGPAQPPKPKTRMPNIARWAIEKGGINFAQERWQGELTDLRDKLNRGSKIGLGHRVVRAQDGLTLDELALMAKDEGYISEATPQALLDALSEMREHPTTQEEDIIPELEAKQAGIIEETATTIELDPSRLEVGDSVFIEGEKYTHRGFDAEGNIIIKNAWEHVLDWGDTLVVDKGEGEVARIEKGVPPLYPVPPIEEKEAWQMTFAEVKAAIEDAETGTAEGWNNNPIVQALYPDSPLGRADFTSLSRRHKEAIKKAISEGQAVPDNILAEYPSLAKEEETPPIEEAEAEETPGQKYAAEVKSLIKEYGFNETDWNENGVYIGEPTEVIEHKTKKAEAKVRLLKTEKGWIETTEMGHKQGSMSGSGGPLSIHDTFYPTREAALAEALKRIIKAQNRVVEDKSSTVTDNQRKEAEKIIKWAEGLMPKTEEAPPILEAEEPKGEKKKPVQGDLIGVTEGLQGPIATEETPITELETATAEAEARQTEEEEKKKQTEIFTEPTEEKEPTAPEPKEKSLAEVDTLELSDYLLKMLKEAGPKGLDKITILAGLNAEFGVKDSTKFIKTIEEAMEFAIVRRAREIAGNTKLSEEDKWDLIKNLYAKQPTLATRTSTSVAGQQYSTPVPIAYLMGKWTGGETAIDTTAGNGMLTIVHDPANTVVNDIDAKERGHNLKRSGFKKVYGEDALKLMDNHPDLRGAFDAVNLNPPFGSIDTVKEDGFKISKLEHLIVMRSLLAMKDNGRAAVIIGGHNFQSLTGQERQMTEADRVFLNYLYSHYNVVSNIDIDGSVYRKMGTSYPIRLILIEGRKAAPDQVFAPAEAKEIPIANNVDNLKKMLEGQKKKLKSTDEALRRFWELRTEKVKEAKGTAEQVLDVILKATNRGDLLDIPLGDNATKRLPAYYAMIRSNTLPFMEWAALRKLGYRPRNISERITELMQTEGGAASVQAAAQEYIELLGKIRTGLAGKNNILEASSALEQLFEDDGGIRRTQRKYRRVMWTSWDVARLAEEEDKPMPTKELNPSDRPSIRLEELEREGLKDYRNGTDVTGEDLKKTFGFASITYGNYANQDLRQLHTNHVFDALHDLAERLRLEPKNMSLGGNLHLAIGALGHGKASAHFSSSHPTASGGAVNVINLTRDRGDGTLSHEWFHALSNHLGRSESVMVALYQMLKKSFNYESLMKGINGFFSGSWHYNIKGEGPTQQAVRWLRYQKSTATETQYYKNSIALDAVKSKPYWGSPEEMAARAFEAWIFDTIDGSSPYLVNQMASEGYAIPPLYKGRIYPEGSERSKFNSEYESLFDRTIEWTEGGPRFREGVLVDTGDDAWKSHIEGLIRNIDDLYRKYLDAETEKVKQERQKEEQAPEPTMPDNLTLSSDELEAIIDEVIDEEIPSVPTETTEAKAETEIESDQKVVEKIKEFIAILDSATEVRRNSLIADMAASLNVSAERVRLLYENLKKGVEEVTTSKPDLVVDEPELNTIIKEFTKSGVNVASETLAALHEIFGGGRIKMFPSGFDEESYNRAKPHFVAAYKAFKKAGHLGAELVRAFAREFIRVYGQTIKPYIVRFLNDIQKRIIVIEEETHGTGEGTEPPGGDVSGTRGGEGEPGAGGRPGGTRPEYPGTGQPEPGRPGAAPAGEPGGAETEGAGEAEEPEVPEGELQPGGPPGDSLAGKTVVDEFGEDLQMEYIPHSKGPRDYNLIPRYMAHSIFQALDRVEERYGPVDEFVAKQLQWNQEELHDALSAAQIDAVALTLANFDLGFATIIGDQTGVGKGRVAASIIRWANLKGKRPIFITATTKLFSDMHRDLTGIGHSYKPFILHNDISSSIVNEKEEIVFRPKRSNNNLAYVIEHQEDYDVFFINYDGLGQENEFRRIIEELAVDNIVIMDESHRASGDSSRGEFLRDTIKEASQVLYMSATYAKRAGTMPLYFRTALGSSGLTMGDLVAVMEDGGVALQQIVARVLAESGQLIRRELDFTGIEFKLDIDHTNREVDYRNADDITNILRQIVHFDALKKPLIIKMNAEAVKEGKRVTGKKHTSAGVTSPHFTSVVHNYIGQLLMAMKADRTVEAAIAALKRGEKPLMNLMNTMESFADWLVEYGNVHPNEPTRVAFNRVLEKALHGTLKYTVKDHKGNETHHFLDPADDPILYRAYTEIVEEINSIDTDLPASPIDYIKAKIREAGYSIGEITGRGFEIDYSVPGVQKLIARKGKERTDRNTPVIRFQDGRLDALLFNGAGSTGISLHADIKSDQKIRHMIVLQADLNIDTFIQALGRIHRKGTVEGKTPRYTFLLTTLPAETRPAAILMKKLQSLNANTTADAESKHTIKDVPNMMNSYGDEVVKELLDDRRDIQGLIDIPSESGIVKITGRAALLPANIQEEFYRELTSKYNDHINYLNQIGENKLTAKSYDFKAETLKKILIYKGDNEESPFTSSAYLERVKVNILKKPFNAAKLEKKIAEALKGKTPAEYKADMLKEIDALATEYEIVLKERFSGSPPEVRQGQLDKFRNQKSTMTTALNTFQFGKLYDLTVTEDYAVLATPIAITYEKPSTRESSPVSPSRLTILFAVTDAYQAVAFKLTNPNLGRTAPVSPKPASATIKQMTETEVVIRNNPGSADFYTVKKFLLESGAKYDGQTYLWTMAREKFKGFTDTLEGLGITYRYEGQAAAEAKISEIAQALKDAEWDRQLPKEAKEERHIVTGNVLRGVEALKSKGEIINYTTADGVVQSGILVPKSEDRTIEGQFTSLMVNDADLWKWLKQKESGRLYAEFGSSNGKFSFSYGREELVVDVPAAKKKASSTGKPEDAYFLDTEFVKLFDREFTSSGSGKNKTMRASVYGEAKARKVIKYVADNFGQKFVIPKEGSEINLQVAKEPEPEARPPLFTEKKTDMPMYDEILKRPNMITTVGWGPQGAIEGNYWKEYKGYDWQVVHMSPDEYLNQAAKGFKKPLSEVLRTRQDLSRIEQFHKGGNLLPLPVLDYRKGGYFSQEGIHRALYAKKLGYESMPVLVFTAGNLPVKDVLRGMKLTDPLLQAKTRPKQALPSDVLIDILEDMFRIAAPGTKIILRERIDIDAASVKGALEQWGMGNLNGTIRIKGMHRLVDMTGTGLRSVLVLSLSDMDLTTGYHEAFHSVEELLLTDAQREILRKAYPDSERMAGKEKRAEAFAAYAVERRGGKKAAISNPVRKIFKQIAEFLERFANVLRGRGFQSARDIFAAAFEGKLSDQNKGKANIVGQSRMYAQIDEFDEFGKAFEPGKFRKNEKKEDLGDLPSLLDKPYEELSERERYIVNNLLDPSLQIADDIRPIDSLFEGIDEQMRGSKLKKSPLLDRMRVFADKVAKSFTRHFISLDSKTDGVLIDILRRVEAIPEYSKWKASREIANIVKNLKPNQYELFSRILILRDMEKDLESGLLSGELPFGYLSAEQVKTDRLRYEALAAMSEEVTTALDMRSQFMTDLKELLIEAKLLPESTRGDDRYFHHQVLEYMALKAMGEQYPGVSSGDVRLHRKGWQIARVGSAKNFNTDYITSEFEVVAQAVSQLEMSDAIDRINMVSNRAGEFKRTAKRENYIAVVGGEENANRLMELRSERDLLKQQRPMDRATKLRLKEISEEIWAIDPTMPYRQRMAIAISQLSKTVRDNLIQIPANMDVFFDEEEGTVGGDLMRLMARLASDGGPGALEARSFFKALSERESFIKEKLGSGYLTMQGIARREGYVMWQPEKGNVFFPVYSMTEKAFSRAVEIMNDPEAEAKAFKEIMEAADVPVMLAMGGKKPEWAIPPRVATALDSLHSIRNEGPVGHASRYIMNSWKQWILINPLRVIKYNINNLSGDLDIAMAYDPRIVTFTKQALKDLYSAKKGVIDRASIEAEINAAMKLGVLSSGITINEIPDITDTGLFNAITGQSPNVITRAWKTLKDFTTLRENVLRLAAYRMFKQDLAAGKAVYGASKRSEVDAIRDRDERAAKLARELIGDYGNVSEAGQWIRAHMIPFYSWMEINAPRYFRLMRNLKHEGREAGRPGEVLAWKATKLGLKATMLYAAIMLWNSTFFPDEDDELGLEGRKQLHIILGRNDDGTIRTLRFQGALSDALAWFGLEDFPYDYRDVVSGKVPWTTKFTEALKATPNRLVQGFRPIEKTSYEVLTGRALYPDMYRPKPIRDKLEHALKAVSMDMPYRVLTGKPSRGTELEGLLVYRTNPGEAAYFDTLTNIRDFLKKKDYDVPDISPTERSNALYYYKLARKYGDKEAMQKYLDEYRRLGGKRKDIIRSIKKADPLSFIPMRYRGEFIKSLDGEDRQRFEMAREWYRSIYSQ